MNKVFTKYATMLEDVYGVQYDKDEEFVICPSCGEPIYECDWPQSTFNLFNDFWYCPVEDETFLTDF